MASRHEGRDGRFDAVRDRCVGEVDGLFVDDEDGPAYVRVKVGGLLRKKTTLIPADIVPANDRRELVEVENRARCHYGPGERKEASRRKVAASPTQGAPENTDVCPGSGGMPRIRVRRREKVNVHDSDGRGSFSSEVGEASEPSGSEARLVTGGRRES